MRSLPPHVCAVPAWLQASRAAASFVVGTRTTCSLCPAGACTADYTAAKHKTCWQDCSPITACGLATFKFAMSDLCCANLLATVVQPHLL